MFPLDSDLRASALINWLVAGLGLQVKTVEPASSDASFRRYFRVRHEQGCDIVMDAPPDKENLLSFIKNAELLKSAQIHVPAIFAENRSQGFLLLEDLGKQCYLDQLSDSNADVLYRDAMDSLFRLQTEIIADSSELPVYDRALLSRELNIFYEWFLENRLGIILPVDVREELNACLLDSALEQPCVVVHRDFHSRNLMILQQDSPGVIDFQDAVVGPVTYDLVSLLRDCYVRWPEARVYQWTNTYYQRLTAAGLVDVAFIRFKRWFDLMGLQRHLKAVGIFSRLDLRDDKPGYLGDIPRTMSYISDICELYPELSGFDAFLKQQILPIYQTKL